MKYEIKSFSSAQASRDPYVVEAHDKGKRWTCTCPHFVFRLKKSGTHCKHIDYVLKNQEQLDSKRERELEDEFWSNFTWEDPVKPDAEEESDNPTKHVAGD